MSILVQNVSMQQLKHEFESFLKRFHRKLLVLQPQIYVVSNITKDAAHLQVTWKSISANGYVTYNASTTYKSNYLLAINQMRGVGDYSLKDAELLADSPFVDIYSLVCNPHNKKLRIHHLKKFLQVLIRVN